MPDSRPGLARRLLRTANRLRARGPGEMFGLAAQRLSEWWRSSEELIMNVRSAGPIASSVEGLSFRPATKADADRYARDVGTDSATTFRARLSADVLCFVVEGDRRLLHASWVTTSAAWTRELGTYLAPPPGDAYIYESFTRADARGRGIYPLALAGMVTWCAERGLDRVWVAAEADNHASRRAIAKAGFEQAFVLPYRRRLGRLSQGAPSGPLSDYAERFIADS